MRQTAQSERKTESFPSRQAFFGRGVYGPEGRRLGALEVTRAGHSGGNQPYAIIELASFSRNVRDLRAVPLSSLSYVDDRGIFLCTLSELSLRSAPSYTSAADWLDDRWTGRLDTYFDGVRR